MNRSAGLLAFPALFLGLFFFRPLWSILKIGLDADAWRWVASPFVTSRLEGAFLQAVLSVLLTMALALPLAWFHHRYSIRWNRAHLAIHAAPFVLPVFVIIFGVQFVTKGLGLSPLAVVVFAHAYYNYGFAARLLANALARRPVVLEDVARTLGATPWQARLRVTLPLILPQVVAISLLVFLFSFSSFGIVLYLGQGNLATLETLMYSVLRGAFSRPERAAALGMLQLAINVGLLLAYTTLLRRQRRVPQNQTVPVQAPWTSTVSWALVALGMVPTGAVLLGGFQLQGAWSLEPWRAILQANHPAHLHGFHLPKAVGLSLLYATGSAAISLTLALCLAYGSRQWGRRLGDVVSSLPLGTSSLLIGFGTILTFGIGGFVDATSGRVLITCAHALIAFPFVARVLFPAIDQHDHTMDAAARTLGANPWQVWLRIHLPLLRPTLMVASGFAVAMSLGDFGASLLLQSADNRGLSVWIDAHGGMGSFNPLVRAQAVALSGLLMVLAAGAYVLLERGEQHA